MNLKLVKLQVLVIGLLSLMLAAEWSYGELARRRLQQNLQYSKDESDISSELPTIAGLKATAVEYGEMVERPLFIEGRKPIVEVAAESVQNVETGQIDDWALIGVYIKDKRSMALFAKKNETKKFLKIGGEQTISGWLLKEIQPDRVILQQAGQLKTVLLRKPRPEIKSPAPEKPAAPAPAKPPRSAKPAAQAPNNNPENANDDSTKN